jgi:DNA-binding HxlR family transcriptional regulator
MKRSPLNHHPCSIAKTLDIAGEWWTPLILRDIAYGVRRFREIQEDLGISANVLADRLGALVEHGLLATRIYQQQPQRHEYLLTEKGTDLIPALLALMQWGDRWAWSRGSGPVSVVHEDCGHGVRVEIHCPQCAHPVDFGELRAKPRGHPPAPQEMHADMPGGVSGRRLYSTEGGVRLG